MMIMVLVSLLACCYSSVVTVWMLGHYCCKVHLCLYMDDHEYQLTIISIYLYLTEKRYPFKFCDYYEM
jgi:hypothetical protein